MGVVNLLCVADFSMARSFGEALCLLVRLSVTRAAIYRSLRAWNHKKSQKESFGGSAEKVHNECSRRTINTPKSPQMGIWDFWGYLLSLRKGPSFHGSRSYREIKMQDESCQVGVPGRQGCFFLLENERLQSAKLQGDKPASQSSMDLSDTWISGLRFRNFGVVFCRSTHRESRSSERISFRALPTKGPVCIKIPQRLKPYCFTTAAALYYP